MSPNRIRQRPSGDFVIQRAEIPVPGRDTRGFSEYTQHYFDSRGVVRLYGMDLQGGVWTLERMRPGFSELRFLQRFEGRISEDGSRIDGAWYITDGPDSAEFKLDFPLTYLHDS